MFPFSRNAILLVSSIACCVLLFISLAYINRMNLVVVASSIESKRITVNTPYTLVVYVFSDTDPVYLENLLFFIDHGLEEAKDCEFVIVIQEGARKLDLPHLPSNAKYWYKSNDCFDLGSVGIVLEDYYKRLNESRSSVKPSHFLFINSSVRGPFYPLYVNNKIKWIEVFTGMISDDTKLVGCTISCASSNHVQAYLLGTDSVGLDVLVKNHVFDCSRNMQEAINKEVAASSFIIAAGYNIGSMMLRYKGVDFKKVKNCNAGLSPDHEDFYDGLSIHPLETMFVKTKQRFLGSISSGTRQTGAVVATKYSEWEVILQGEKEDELRRNSGGDGVPIKVQQMRNRGSKCFNTTYYCLHNLDLHNFSGDLWEHWVTSGQFEARDHFWMC